MAGRLILALAYCPIALLLFLNVVATGYHMRVRLFKGASGTNKEYSYEGDDHPHQLLLELGGPVALTIEDSVHFQAAAPEARAEWSAVYPPGRGYIHLGPQQIRYGVSMYHQLHCLDTIRQAILQGVTNDHINHCLNYLRQNILCSADVTLEAPDPAVLDANSEPLITGIGMTHQCRDWTKVYHYIGDRYYEWKAKNASLNTSSVH